MSVEAKSVNFSSARDSQFGVVVSDGEVSRFGNSKSLFILSRRFKNLDILFFSAAFC